MISSTEQASLLNNTIDTTLDSELRSKNFFTDNNQCGLWNYTTYEYKSGTELYNYMAGLLTKGLVYPILKVSESSSNSLFETYTSHIFDEANKPIIEATKYPVTITYMDSSGSVDITTAIDSETSVSSAQGPQIAF
mgnify:CR=1 FL=1